MRTLYLECNMGAAGDMLTAALAGLFEEPYEVIEQLNQLGIPNVNYILESSVKCGIHGLQVRVLIAGHEEGVQEKYSGTQESDDSHDHHHHHTSMREIKDIVDTLLVSDSVKQNVFSVYQLIAEAESRVHGQTVEEIHFHEVGSMDAVADVVAVCYLIERLNVDRIIASPVRVGYGQVQCAHGILPVPAPATAVLTEGIPTYSGNLEGEFCTPTGAALLKYFVSEFERMPVLRMIKTGYGMGKREFETVNCVRAMLGEEAQESHIIELCCNLDDMIPENIGFVTELLMKEGALDVYTTNIQMKKNRPGILLTCMCRETDREKFLTLIFKHTTTLGIREYDCKRYGLNRKIKTVRTPYGEVHYKFASGYGVEKSKPEYEDIAAIARKTGNSLENIKSDIERNSNECN